MAGTDTGLFSVILYCAYKAARFGVLSDISRWGVLTAQRMSIDLTLDFMTFHKRCEDKFSL